MPGTQQTFAKPDLGGKLPLGSMNSSSSVSWALGKRIPDHVIGLSVGNSSGALHLGGSSTQMDWWNPIEDAFGSWAFLIEGVAVDGQVVEPIQPIIMNSTKRQAEDQAMTPTSVQGTSPTRPSTNPGAGNGDGANCVACTLEYKVCSCASDETCVRHPATCNECEWLECVKNNTGGTGGEDCVACPDIYKSCDCAADEECVRTPQTCKACETVECRKKDTNTTTPPPEPPAGNCTKACPAIYQMCTCHADETCVRQSTCDKCEWLECHKPKPKDNGTCVTCSDPEPECDCKLGSICVRTPRSCNDCGKVECRNDANGTTVRMGLSLDDEIAVSPVLARAIFDQIPGASEIGNPPVTSTMRPTTQAPEVSTMRPTTQAPEVSTMTPTTWAPGASPSISSNSSSGDASSGSSSVTAPPRPEGKTYYAVPCNTTATITFLFPSVNYTLKASDWVIPHHGGCRAVLVAQDTVFNDIVAGRPFLRTVDTAFRFEEKAKVGFARLNTTVADVAAVQGQSGGAGTTGVSVAAALVAVAGLFVF